eukprot:gene2002-biopygen1271
MDNSHVHDLSNGKGVRDRNRAGIEATDPAHPYPRFPTHVPGTHVKYPYLTETGAQDRKSVWAQADENPSSTLHLAEKSDLQSCKIDIFDQLENGKFGCEGDAQAAEEKGSVTQEPEEPRIMSATESEARVLTAPPATWASTSRRG